MRGVDDRPRFFSDDTGTAKDEALVLSGKIYGERSVFVKSTCESMLT